MSKQNQKSVAAEQEQQKSVEQEQQQEDVAEQEPQQSQAEVEVGEPDSSNPNPNREAAKYRRRLRETEAERDQLAARLELMQRGKAEMIAGSMLDNPAGLWFTGATVADLLDAEGNVDPDKVRAVAENAIENAGLRRRYEGRAPVIPQIRGNNVAGPSQSLGSALMGQPQ